MKKSIALGVVGAFMSHGWHPPMIATVPVITPCYSYPISTTRRTGKAAERRKAKQHRRARA